MKVDFLHFLLLVRLKEAGATVYQHALGSGLTPHRQVVCPSPLLLVLD